MSHFSGFISDEIDFAAPLDRARAANKIPHLGYRNQARNSPRTDRHLSRDKHAYLTPLVFIVGRTLVNLRASDVGKAAIYDAIDDFAVL
jgi:hypothetical protein